MSGWLDAGSLKIDPSDRQFLILKQQSKYEAIRNRSSRIAQGTLSFISLIASLGALQFIIGNRPIQSVIVNIPDEAVNRCSPEALTYSDVSLRGFGYSNSLIAFGVLGLSMWLLIEMWFANRRVQNLPTLSPNTEVEVIKNTYREILAHNRTRIADANRLLDTILYKVYFSFGFAALALTHYLLLKFGFVYAVTLLTLLMMVAGILFIGFCIFQYFSDSKDLGMFRFDSHHISPVFIVLCAFIWGFALYEYSLMFRLITRFVIC
jgi:hypothetical protein